ncbi:MAG: hypothetical protein KBI40_04670 [Firmicutes bacterium]|nr:hypothetical protein [Candidatus Fermentithermobacillaceae bacterium]
MSNDRIVSTKDIEALLACLPGVQKARVVVDDWGAIKEIHILTGLDRSPKQIVRDVESALKAQWNINVDRRKVSVAQVKTKMPPADDRLRFVSLEVKTDAKKGTSEVCVSLERNHEDEIVSYTGRSEGDLSPRSVLYAIARATCLAANLTIPPSSEIFVDDVQSVKVGQKDAVNVLVGLSGAGLNCEYLLGAALVRREVGEACVRATLDAINRRLELLDEMSSSNEYRNVQQKVAEEKPSEHSEV